MYEGFKKLKIDLVTHFLSMSAKDIILKDPTVYYDNKNIICLLVLFSAIDSLMRG